MPQQSNYSGSSSAQAGLDSSFWGHLEVLRKTVIRIFFLVICSTVIAFLFHEQIFFFLTKPLESTYTHTDHHWVSVETKQQRFFNHSTSIQELTLPDQAIVLYKSDASIKALSETLYQLPPGTSIEIAVPKKDRPLVILSPIEGMLSSLKISIWVGILVSSPIALYLLLDFISPGLRAREKGLIFPFMALSLAFISLGLTLAYGYTIPFANVLLAQFNSEIATNFWALSSYIDYTILIILANGLAFEAFVVLLFLVHYGILSPSWMRKKRRYIIVAIFILSAILTPPDVFTQCMMAFPLVILYEVSIIYGSFREKSKLKKAKLSE